MRNALKIADDLIVTTDNSGGIGEKVEDLVQAPDQLTASFSARVALLEQWAAHAELTTVLLHNFTGAESWDAYVAGVQEVLAEAGIVDVPITGSTETNMDMLQSALAVTMIGRVGGSVVEDLGEGQWFTYGEPLVGKEVLEHPGEVASLGKLKTALDAGKVQRIWPTGSAGIRAEICRMMETFDSTENDRAQVIDIKSPLNLEKSCGPSTVVLLRIESTYIEEMTAFFGPTLRPLIIHYK